ncbi:kelch repeat-containing protein [Streptomyces sp. NPDC046931]|uniref:kelch repeat-containing protein n=1 Tax=Streptomyces sp. NPDC046931 TaxID=3154806 RepID=UPI003402E7D7
MCAEPRYGRLPRSTSLLTGGLMALLALFAVGLATPAAAATGAHQKASRVTAAPAAEGDRCGKRLLADRRSHVLGGGKKCGTTTTFVQVSHTEQCGPDTFCSSTANCPAGSVVVGGGIGTNTFISNDVWLYETKPIGTTAWEGTYRNRTNITFPITAYAICAQSS